MPPKSKFATFPPMLDSLLKQNGVKIQNSRLNGADFDLAMEFNLFIEGIKVYSRESGEGGGV